MSHQKVYVFRHGETEWSLKSRHTGVTDLPLTEKGREKAKLIQPLLAKQTLALVLTSPLQRARQTCELAGVGEQAEVDTDLVEWNYGDYEGLTTEQIHAQNPGWFVFDSGSPGGETPEEVGKRVDRAITKIRAADGDVALFAHGHLLRVLVARWLGLSASAGRHFDLDTATLNILGYYHAVSAILTWNAPLC
ncbi:MAG: histidine phosphatase family protein [Cyanophyceae cyanobacterium]